MQILVSVSNKTGIVDFINDLRHFKLFENKEEEIIATEGTAAHLRKNGINVTRVSEITGYRQSKELKTIDFKLYEAIFSGEIQFVIVNLYPFEETPSIQNIAIGGVSLLRASAKNYEKVVVISHPEMYEEVVKHLSSMPTELRVSKSKGIDIFPLPFRKKLAQKAFKYVSKYDNVISEWLKG